MLTLTHNYSDRHATINCNFKSLKILHKNIIKLQHETKKKKQNVIEMIVFYVWIKIKWNVFYMKVYNKWHGTQGRQQQQQHRKRLQKL